MLFSYLNWSIVYLEKKKKLYLSPVNLLFLEAKPKSAKECDKLKCVNFGIENTDIERHKWASI